MDTDLKKSLDIAQAMLAAKRHDLRVMSDILQSEFDLSDDLVVIMAEMCNHNLRKISELERCIGDVDNYLSVFGPAGPAKTIDTSPKEDYPPDQRFDD